MTTLVEIKDAVNHLPRKEFSSFSSWFDKYEEKRWDDEIKNDINNGLLDSLGDEAIAEFKNGSCKKL